MSRIGKKPITLPAGVTLVMDGQQATVKGPKGTLTRTIDKGIAVEVNGTEVLLTVVGKAKDIDAKHGLYRSLLNNMVVGVSTGFTKSLIINGVGYKSAVAGNKLTLNIGYSHPIDIVAPEGITITCVTPTEIAIAGFDKELVGQVAANIKAKRPVEPYHAYGVRYKDEQVIMKEGKKSNK